jgi:hypothetical protein
VSWWRRRRAKARVPDALARLQALVPPPHAPVERADPRRWPEVEAELGTALPADYKALVEAYGSGRFDELLWLFSPFAPRGPGNLLDERHTTLDAYRESRRRFPDRLPLPPFPEPGGLLPLGRSDNGNELYWLTGGAPDAWAVVLFGGRSTEHEQHPPGVAAFLAGVLTGELPTRLLPRDLARRPAHTFTPFE